MLFCLESQITNRNFDFDSPIGAEGLLAEKILFQWYQIIRGSTVSLILGNRPHTNHASFNDAVLCKHAEAV